MFKKLKAVVVCAVLCCFSIFSINKSSNFGMMRKFALNQESDSNHGYKGELVFSYEDVAESYLNLYNDSHPNVFLSLKEFVEQFRSQKSDLVAFCNSDNIATQTASRSKGAEDYILGTYIGEDESYTDASYFKRPLNKTLYDYSVVLDGDIIYEAEADDPKHVAFVYNSRANSSYGSYIQTIESAPDKVQFGFLDDDRIVRKGVSVYRIYRALELNVVSRAKKFIRKQVGKDYSYDFTKTDTSEDETAWYCSELVFAAYWAGGMNIGSTSTYEFDPTTTCITPTMITWGMLTGRVSLADSWVNISIDNFSDGKWSIYVSNPNSYSIDLEYNEKMCFENDAKSWTKLKNVKTIQLSSRSYSVVKIQENFFATTIAFSYCKNNYRYITYANELTKGGYTMSVRYVKITI